MDQQCPDCAADLPANALECPQCGQRLDDVTVLGRPGSDQVTPAPAPRPRGPAWPLLLAPAALMLAGIGMIGLGGEDVRAAGGMVLVAGVLFWAFVRFRGMRR